MIYLHINLLIAVSLLVFMAVLGLAKSAGVRPHYGQFVRVGQLFIVTSILVPVGLHLVPNAGLPELTFPQFRPDLDGMAGRQSRGKPDLLQQNIDGGTWAVKAEPSLTARVSGWMVVNHSFAVAGAFFLWLSGFCFCVVRFLRNANHLKSILAEATLIRWHGKVRVAVSERIAVPFSVRWFQWSWVILPVSLLGSRGDLRLAIKHELQHHRQGDTPWAIVVEILLCCFYVNPALYLWKRKITEFQEFSCDEALLGQRGVSIPEYGSCLVRVAETALVAREMYVGTTCMAAGSKDPIYFKSFLQRRIEMIVDRRSPAQKWFGISMGTLGLLCVVAVAYGAEQLTRRADAPIQEPNSGTVSVNEAIQKIAEKALREAIVAEKASEGFAIVADPNTGKMLAVANIDTKNKKSGQWALSELMEPASLTKVLIASQAIENGLTTPQESHSCESGSYRFGKHIYHDWKEGGWAKLTTEETITYSSDICSIKMGEKLGASGLVKMLKDFGFGENGIARSFPAARSGNLPPADSPADPKLVPYVASGFGYQSTPIEMLQAYGAIANGGNLLKPLQANAPDSDREVLRRVMSSENAEKMRSILQQVVIKGTAKARAESALYSTAGKTATGYSTSRLGTEKKANLAQFIGFAPVSHPRIEVYVAIRDPGTDNGGAHGSQHAAPVFKKIVEGVLKELKVTPDKIQE